MNIFKRGYNSPVCDICGRNKQLGNHDACYKARQRAHAGEPRRRRNADVKKLQKLGETLDNK